MMAAIDLERVSKRYRGTTALRQVDLALNASEIVGLVGPNGAGKTTLLRLCAGLLRPTAGQVTFGVRRSLIRYFAGERSLPPNVSVRAWRRLWLPRDPREATRQRIGELSRGQRQRLGLETAIAAGERRVVLLDEPWEGLDPDAARWLSDELLAARAGGAVVLVSSHRVHELAAICDRCEILVNGALARPAVLGCAPVWHEARVCQLLEAYDRARRAQ